MSDIVIRGMKKPKRCGECPAIKSPAGFTGNTYYDGCYLDESLEVMAEERHENCPLIELQTHGDLIDRRKLWKDTEGLGEYCYDRDFISLCDAISEAPTILKASK